MTVFKSPFACLLGCLAGSVLSALADPIPVLKRSDVIFMYQAPRAVYEQYGATVLAWGGTPDAKSLEQASGIKFFGSVGMVTEFGRYYERFPQTYQEGLCRDLNGEPFKVPWLTDHQHKGVPFWWCCTRQPLFRQYLSERVIATVKAGAFGVHIDDHLGTAGPLWTGGCFCDRCDAEFPAYLKTLPEPELRKHQVDNAADYSYRGTLRRWLAEKPGRKIQDHPLWQHWRVYQLRGAAAFMAELRGTAARTGERAVPMSANACLLWGPHLNDYQSLDFFSAEIEHHASEKRFSDAPVLAYRLADAVDRPLASTASGGDWAFIKENNLPGLVQGWIALGYAAGHSLMAPYRQWCHTPQKGTHWYDGPAEKFSPFYRFVHDNPGLFDGYETLSEVTVAVSQNTFDRDPSRIAKICSRLCAANISYSVALGGNEVVEHPLPAEQVRRARRLLLIEQKDFAPQDQRVLETAPRDRIVASIDQVLTNVAPAVQFPGAGPVRAFARAKAGSALVHLLNWNYNAERDGVDPLENLQVKLDLEALGAERCKEARLFAPGAEPIKLPVDQGRVVVPKLELWAILELKPL